MPKFVEYFSRFAMAVIYIWFGALKLIGTSPANPLVEALQQQTIPFISFATFIIILGCFEILIGLLFLLPRAKWLALILFVIHMIITTGPLVLLPAVTWQANLTPTLEGQYIIKNLALIAVALNLTFNRRS